MPDSPYSSPWLAQLKADRPHFRLEQNTQADVAVVGAGIAGVMTAYQILRHTGASILLVDAGRIAHGATGRNAGQVVSYFERPFGDIVQEFGRDMAVAAQLAVESAWDDLEDILRSCNLQTPLHKCAGYAGLTRIEQIIEILEEHDIQATAGIAREPMLVKVDASLKKLIPGHLLRHTLEVPHSMILQALHTDDPAYIAATATKKGCTNSALLCEELAAWMIQNYGERLRIAEHLPVHRIVMRASDAELTTGGPSITAHKVVLCTNGFENFDIINEAGEDIDPSFHATVNGTIGYMAGYFDEPEQMPIAIRYHHEKSMRDPYYYLTRRPYEHAQHGSKTLLCIGGPERPLPDRADYDPHVSPPADISEQLEQTLRSTYRDFPPAATRMFLWQGLMGYTPNGIRRIGFEPRNNVLLYNLGCNGVGILPSIYGARRIARLLSGIHLPPSIFDPVDGEGQ